ncbi:amidohydrolase family protein [Novosphingopyxis baekryungensis]|uniref:amidohydrolase family protein n=1 Tax=Novosphingopyxis baekryungensis TaxID=279369 RepID=UPI0003B6B23E|nr:amidohydrolase family protein [Novosphingopyxis baekryungensis]
MRAVKTISVAFAMLGGAVLLAFFALVLWPSSDAPLPDQDRDRVIVGVRIVDVVAGVVGPPRSVEIRNGRITTIGTGPVPSDVPRLDGQGAFLVPGFWDMHVHSFQASPQMHFPLWIANGVTSVRDMMDCPGERDSLIACVADKRRWNAAVAAGRLAAPRIVETASYYFENPDLSPAEARARVRAYKARGIDAIKVYNRLSPASYRAVAAEARSQQIRLVGHLPKAVGLDDAINAGQVSFEHARVLPHHCFARAEEWRRGALDDMMPTALAEMIVDEYDPPHCDAAFARMRQAGAWYVPTHVTREEDARAGDPSLADDPRLAYLDPLSRWAWNDDLAGTRNNYPGGRGERALRRYFEHGRRLTGAAHRAGVGILVGTDTAIGGFRYHDEMAHLVSAGLTPADVLRAATIDAARYAGMADSSGSVAVGKRADLVLLDANPLENIANTRQIRAVVQDGRLYDRNRLDGLLTFVRAQSAAVHNWAKLLWSFAGSSVSSEL